MADDLVACPYCQGRGCSFDKYGVARTCHQCVYGAVWKRTVVE